MFAPAWSTRTDEDDPGASFFNGARKNVVSSTLRDPDRNNSRAMLRDGLVDGLHLFV